MAKLTFTITLKDGRDITDLVILPKDCGDDEIVAAFLDNGTLDADDFLNVADIQRNA